MLFVFNLHESLTSEASNLETNFVSGKYFCRIRTLSSLKFDCLKFYVEGSRWNSENQVTISSYCRVQRVINQCNYCVSNPIDCNGAAHRDTYKMNVNEFYTNKVSYRSKNYT